MTTKVKFTTPFGVARYPHISSPDTKGKYADNKFKVKLVLPLGSPEAQSFIAKIEEAAKELGKSGKSMYRPYTEDEDTNEAIFVLKTNYAPPIFDGRGHPAKGVKVGAGSVIRLLGNIVPYEKGITMQFNQVQIKELSGFGESGFEAIDDGYEFSEDDVYHEPQTDNAGEAASNGSALDI